LGNGVLDLWDSVYEPSTSATPTCGDVYWIPTPEVNEVPTILDVSRITPTEHFAAKFEILQIDPNRHYKSATRLPIKRLGLGDTEELLVSKSKLRPCIVLCASNVPEGDLSGLVGREKASLGTLLIQSIW